MLQSDEIDLVLEVEKAVNELRVGFTENGGDLSFIKFESGIVFVQFVGSCIGYPASQEIVRSMIEAELRRLFPEVEKVVNL